MGEGTSGEGTVDRWRRRILDAVLLGFALLGAVAYVPSVRLALAVELPSIVVADTAVLILIVGLLFLRRLPYAEVAPAVSALRRV